MIEAFKHFGNQVGPKIGYWQQGSQDPAAVALLTGKPSRTV